ncbi:MAG: hypothetical protein OWU33_12740 [Firmicutes bacterium]|nr:hypothetical protein [Bacillota bacterium]
MTGLEHRYLEYLFFAYSGLWVIMWGFLGRMAYRAQRLEAELRHLKEETGAFHVEDAPTSETSWPGPSV